MGYGEEIHYHIVYIAVKWICKFAITRKNDKTEELEGIFASAESLPPKNKNILPSLKYSRCAIKS